MSLLGSSKGLFARDAPVARRPLVSAQERCDRIQAEARLQPGDRIRRGSLSPPPLTPSNDLIDRRLAEELDYARRVLSAIGERLVGDPTILARHASTVQGFDILAQSLGHLASVVGAADREQAIDRIGMTELRTRTRRKSLADEAIVRPAAV